MVFKDFLGKLKAADVENAESDLCEIVSYVSRVSYDTIRKALLLRTIDSDESIKLFDEKINNKVFDLVNERCKGKPVQYLTERAYFYGREFFVDDRVLIPRFDTECVIDSIIDKIDVNSKVLDLCCGSGCIGLTIALEKKCNVTLADVSKDALEVSKINTKRLLADNVSFIETDVLRDEIHGKFDLIISNPPYISDEDMLTLSKEVLCEPEKALRAGDGYVFYNIIPRKFFNSLSENGYLVFETGYDQGERVAEICRKAGYCDVAVHKDYSGINRAVVAHKYLE